MKYYVLNRGDELSISLTEAFHKLAQQHGMILDERSPEIVISIGGDGTLLHAFHMFSDQLDRVSLLGIHTGHLGFYADWKADELEELVKLMVNPTPLKEQSYVEYPVLEIEIATKEMNYTHLALNEFTLKGVSATLVAQLHINDEMFEMFRGDGICISTPTGSTAYNKSVGGAVIHPSLETIQIAEIASINNSIFRTMGSSIILPKHHHCDIYPRDKQKLLLTIDHLQIEHDNIVSIKSMVSNKKVRFARYRQFPFWNRVKRAFIGNDFN